MNKIILSFFSIALFSLHSTSFSAQWSFPAPRGAYVEWVAQDAEVNNLVIKARKFSSKQDMESVLAFYRELWSDNYAEIDYGPWRMISAKNEGLMYTVQVQKSTSGRGSFGILGVSDIADKILSDDFIQEIGKHFPKMQGSEVVSEMKMSDPGKNAKTILLSNKYSVASNVSYYKNHYRDWQVRSDQSTGFTGPHTLTFTNGRKEVNLVISRDTGKTNIVANVVNKEILKW